MKKILLLILMVTNIESFAFEKYNFSLIFGTNNLTNDQGEETYGSGLSLRSELFVEDQWGMLLSGGAFQTESDTQMNGGSEFKYNTTYGQAGAFIYFSSYFRLAGGVAMANIDETKRTLTHSTSNQFTELGPFYEIGFKYPLRPVVLGIDYIYQNFGGFTQRGLFFMLGFVF